MTDLLRDDEQAIQQRWPKRPWSGVASEEVPAIHLLLDRLQEAREHVQVAQHVFMSMGWSAEDGPYSKQALRNHHLMKHVRN